MEIDLNLSFVFDCKFLMFFISKIYSTAILIRTSAKIAITSMLVKTRSEINLNIKSLHQETLECSFVRNRKRIIVTKMKKFASFLFYAYLSSFFLTFYII